jgi:hypothetical protein
VLWTNLCIHYLLHLTPPLFLAAYVLLAGSASACRATSPIFIKIVFSTLPVLEMARAVYAEHDSLLDPSKANKHSDQSMASAVGSPNVIVMSSPSLPGPNQPSPSQSPATSNDFTSSHLLLPVPTSSVNNTSQASFSLSDEEVGLFDPLLPEIASADISIARK